MPVLINNCSSDTAPLAFMVVPPQHRTQYPRACIIALRSPTFIHESLFDISTNYLHANEIQGYGFKSG